jgi:hypothetical protein
MDESGRTSTAEPSAALRALGEGQATLRPMAGEGELNVHRDFPG